MTIETEALLAAILYGAGFVSGLKVAAATRSNWQPPASRREQFERETLEMEQLALRPRHAGNLPTSPPPPPYRH